MPHNLRSSIAEDEKVHPNIGKTFSVEAIVQITNTPRFGSAGVWSEKQTRRISWDFISVFLYSLSGAEPSASYFQ